MSEVIQCPQCDKRFRLPDNPPATFTCTNCQTLMDLSDFGGVDQPEPAEADPGPSRRGRGAGSPRSRRSRARGGGRSGDEAGGGAAAAPPGPSRAGARAGSRRAGGRATSRRGGRGAARRGGRGRRGAAAHEDDYDDAGGYRGRPPKGSNSGLVIGIIAIVALAAVVIVVMLNKGGGSKDEETVAKKPPAEETGGTPKPSTPEPTAPDPTPTAGGTDTEPAPPRKPKRGGRVRLSKVTLKTFEWPAEVDEATRAKVEEAIASLYRGDRHSINSAEWLVEQGRPVAGRLISEFKTLEPSISSRDAKSKLGAIDQVLRKMDGWIERRWKEEKSIKHFSTPSFVMGILKRWTYWWESDEWKENPREPWDPMMDDWDDPERKKMNAKKNKKKSFGKPAGR